MTAHSFNPADVFHLLHGSWHLERTIPGQATMHGTATIGPFPPSEVSPRPTTATQPQLKDPQLPARNPDPTALYTESVEIHTTTGHQLTGTAHYLFTHRPDDCIDVHLPATGVLFHTLRFTRYTEGNLEAQATHLCAADIYISTYRVLSPSRLYIEHRVHGPRKHYVTQTTLTRAHPEPAT